MNIAVKTEYRSRSDTGNCHTLAKSAPGRSARGAQPRERA